MFLGKKYVFALPWKNVCGRPWHWHLVKKPGEPDFLFLKKYGQTCEQRPHSAPQNRSYCLQVVVVQRLFMLQKVKIGPQTSGHSWQVVAIWWWSLAQVWLYRWTSLYARDRDYKNRLKYNKFANKKTKDDCKLEDRFQKKAISGLHIHKIADKKTAYNKDHVAVRRNISIFFAPG